MASLSGLRAPDRIDHLTFFNADGSRGHDLPTFDGSTIRSNPALTPDRCGTFGAQWSYNPNWGNDGELWKFRRDLRTAHISGRDVTTIAWGVHRLTADYNGNTHDGSGVQGVPIRLQATGSFEASADAVVAEATILAHLWIYNTNGTLGTSEALDGFTDSNGNDAGRNVAQDLGPYDFDNRVLTRYWPTTGLINRAERLIWQVDIRLKETSGIGYAKAYLHGLAFVPDVGDGFNAGGADDGQPT